MTKTTVSPLIDVRDAEALEIGYRSRNHGAKTACRLFPQLRAAIIENLKDCAFTTEQLETLQGLTFPAQCSVEVFNAIAMEGKLDIVEEIGELTQAEVIILVNLIQQNTLIRELGNV
jgi:hypothetical protein